MLLNDGNRYPLEKMLRSLAKLPTSYIVGLLDCCREKLRRADGGQMRGLGEGDDDDDEAMLLGQPKDATENFIITYGC